MTPQRREASSASDSDLERTVACTMLSDQIGADQIRNSCKYRRESYRRGAGARAKYNAIGVATESAVMRLR